MINVRRSWMSKLNNHAERVGHQQAQGRANQSKAFCP